MNSVSVTKVESEALVSTGLYMHAVTLATFAINQPYLEKGLYRLLRHCPAK